MKYRGKRYDNGKWVYGSLIVLDDECQYIVPRFEGASTAPVYQIIRCTMEEIDPATIGRYTGLNEKLNRTGKEIYEDDLVEVKTMEIKYQSRWVKGVVKFLDGCFEVEFCEPIYDVLLKTYRTRLYLKYFVANNAIKVLGNIHDNPELLEIKHVSKNSD